MHCRVGRSNSCLDLAEISGKLRTGPRTFSFSVVCLTQAPQVVSQGAEDLEIAGIVPALELDHLAVVLIDDLPLELRVSRKLGRVVFDNLTTE